MTEAAFGFGAASTIVDDVAVPDNPALDEGSDGFYDESEGGGGTFRPRILPGPVKFRVAVERVDKKDNAVSGERGHSVQTLANGKVPTIIYHALVLVGGEQGIPSTRLTDPIRDGSATELKVSFNEASGFKSEKMKTFVNKNGQKAPIPSTAERLYAAMGLQAEFGPPKGKHLDEMIRMIQGATDRIAEGRLGWNASIKVSDGPPKEYETYSTDTKSVKDSKPWSFRNADGSIKDEAAFTTGDSKIARESIVALYPPRKAKTATA